MIDKLVDYVSGLVPRSLDFVISLVIAIAILAIGGKIVKKLLTMLRNSLLKKDTEPGVVSFLISALKVVAYVLLVIIAAQVLGFATSSIVALVGSAGLAIGLALQGSLANFAGGVLILLMKPFRVGDYVIVDAVEGTVQKIDIVYTTLHTADNRAVILPNGKLADSNIINATREDRRRIDINVGIEYSQNISEVRNVLLDIANSQQERLAEMPIDVVVSSLDDSAVTMAVHLWVKPEDYWTVRWRMLEEVKNQFDAHGIVIPFNQLDVNLNQQ